MKKAFFISPFYFLLFYFNCVAQASYNSGVEISQFRNDPLSKPIVKRIELSKTVELEYTEQGNGNGMPVIFLHGYSDSWHSFESILSFLPADVHAFVPTHRGHGNSSRPLKGYSPKDFSNDL